MYCLKVDVADEHASVESPMLGTRSVLPRRFLSNAILIQVSVSSFNASVGGETAHAWTVTFMSISGDVAELVVDATGFSSGTVEVAERLKVRQR